MTEDGISRVAVFGTGQMGPGIAAVAALAGCRVTLVGRGPSSVERGSRRANDSIQFLVKHGVISQAEANAARSRLTTTDNPQAALPADLAVECIIENLAIKQQFMRGLDAMFPPQTIISSDTSGLRITDIAAMMVHPERAVTTHFWNPPHLMPLVEVIQGEKTAEDTVQRTYSFLKRCGKEPVIGRKDVPGQIGNRILHAVIRECTYMVQEGIASVEDVERAIKNGPGLRFPVYGPLEHSDIVSITLSMAVQASVLPSLSAATEPQPLMKSMAAAGNLGVKTGKGFYDWSQRSVDELIAQRDAFLVERLKASRKST